MRCYSLSSPIRNDHRIVERTQRITKVLLLSLISILSFGLELPVFLSSCAHSISPLSSVQRSRGRGPVEVWAAASPGAPAKFTSGVASISVVDRRPESDLPFPPPSSGCRKRRTLGCEVRVDVGRCVRYRAEELPVPPVHLSVVGQHLVAALVGTDSLDLTCFLPQL